MKYFIILLQTDTHFQHKALSMYAHMHRKLSLDSLSLIPGISFFFKPVDNCELCKSSMPDPSISIICRKTYQFTSVLSM